MDTDIAYALGYNAGKHGPNMHNTHFSIFETRELSAAWQQGYDLGLQRKRNAERKRTINSHDPHTQPDRPED